MDACCRCSKIISAHPTKTPSSSPLRPLAEFRGQVLLEEDMVSKCEQILRARHVADVALAEINLVFGVQKARHLLAARFASWSAPRWQQISIFARKKCPPASV